MAAPDDAIEFPYRDEELENGLRVILHRDASTPVVAVHVMYHVGSKDERPGRTGFAHLFEHLLFQGSEHVAKGEHFRYVQDAGGTGNGTTSFDRTNYYETLPSNQLALGLWLESDRMGFFAPGITQEKLDNQREVVKNERKQVMDNRPYGRAGEALLEQSFPEGHPYRHHPIGSMEDLDRATVEDVHDFFRTFYRPNNATLVVAGDVEPGAALEEVDRWFGEIPAGDRPPRREVPEVTSGGVGRTTLEDQVQVPRVYLSFPAPSFRDPGFVTADVLAEVLAGGKSSRLHRELVYRQRVAGDVGAAAWPMEATGMFRIVATGRPGVEAGRLEAGIRETLDGLVADGPTEAEIEGARNRVRRGELSTLDNVGDRAGAFAHAAVLRDDPGLVNRILGEYAAVEGSAVAELAREALRPERMAVVRVVPVADAGREEAA
jgi:zinc protease